MVAGLIISVLIQSAICFYLYVVIIPDRSVADRYRGCGGDGELVAAGADAGHRRHLLRAAHRVPLLLAQHQAPRGCE